MAPGANVTSFSGATDGAKVTDLVFAQKDPAVPLVLNAEKIVTIADILPDDFPETSTVGWQNANGKNTYADGTYFYICKIPCSLSTVLEKEDDNFVLSGDDGLTVTFVMATNKLARIVCSGAKSDAYNGEYLPPVAQIGDTTYSTLSAALSAAQEGEVVKLLVDLKTSENICVKNDTILDLNNHTINTTGTVTNDGVIVLYNKNASIIDYLLYDVKGAYGTGEELKLPDDSNPKYVVPASTFVTAEVDAGGNQTLEFASGNECLVWNENVKKGTQLKVFYCLALGGDIIAPDNVPDRTHVETTNLKLNKDITVGSNDDNAGFADLSVLSIIDEDPEFSTKGSIDPNSHKIIINESGSFTISDDISFDESIIVSGVDGMVVEKVYDETNKVYSFAIVNEQRYENKPFELTEGSIKDLEFVTTGLYLEEGDVTVKVDNKLVDPSKYDLAHGSTHITLHKGFVSTLAVGKHTMTVAIDGYNTISQDFIIKAKSNPTPNPGYIVPNTSVK